MYRYHRQAARLRRSFAGRYVEARRDEQPQVTVPEAEAAAYERIQQRHLDANLRQALRTLSSEAEDPYAVVITPEAHAALRGLSAEVQAALYEHLGQLQTTPQPAATRPASDGAGLMLFEAGHTLTYTVDDKMRRVTVTAVAAAVESVDGG
jgi:hypothetical protein